MGNVGGRYISSYHKSSADFPSVKVKDAVEIVGQDDKLATVIRTVNYYLLREPSD